MHTNRRNELRSDGYKAWLASLGAVRVELLKTDAPAFTPSKTWNDYLDHRADFPGYRASTVDPEDMIGPSLVEGKYKVQTIPLIFQQNAESDEPCEVNRTALVVRIGPEGDWEDVLLDVSLIMPSPWSFEEAGQTESVSLRLTTGECSDEEEEGEEGEEEDSDDNLLMVDDETSFSEEGETDISWGS